MYGSQERMPTIGADLRKILVRQDRIFARYSSNETIRKWLLSIGKPFKGSRPLSDAENVYQELV